MRNRLAEALGALAAVAALALAGCEGSATQTTNGGLKDGELGGVLVDQQGYPVPNAKVQVWQANAVSTGVPGSDDPPEALTDKDGRYKVTDLPPGQYNVFGRHSGGISSVLIPSVEMAKLGLDLGVDTLKPPGKVVGKTVTAEGPVEGVFCYLPGSSYISISDEDGSFALNGVPEGTYRLKYAAPGYSTITDTIAVVSGEILVLPPRKIGPDIDAQPPIPQGLRASYDTVRGSVTLRWNPVRISDLKDYVLFLQEKNKEPTQLGSLGKDTVLVDSSMRGLFLPGSLWAKQDTGTLIFMIKARDMEDNLSRSYSEPFALRMTRPQVYQGRFTILPVGIDDTTVCRDTLVIRTTFESPVKDAWAYAIDVTRKPNPYTWEAVYREKGGGAKPGDTLTFVWYYGKGQGDSNFPGNYPPRAVFDTSTFEIQMVLVGTTNWYQPMSVDVFTYGNGCLTPDRPREREK